MAVAGAKWPSKAPAVMAIKTQVVRLVNIFFNGLLYRCVE
jgi:hypothetical protein